MTITTPEQMRAAVERWARARGWLASQHAHGPADHWLVDESRLFNFNSGQDTGRLRIYMPGQGESRDVDPHTALLWACTVEAGLPLVDVGRCQACDGAQRETRTITCRVERGTPRASAWRRHQRTKEGWRNDGWRWAEGSDVLVERPISGVSDVLTYTMWRPCLSCASKPGREHRDPARMVLDAHAEARDFTSDRTEALDRIAVLADRLQADGVDLGEWLAHWLAGSREGTADAVERIYKAAEAHVIARAPELAMAITAAAASRSR